MATLPAPKASRRARRHRVATVICHGVAPFEMAVRTGRAGRRSSWRPR